MITLLSLMTKEETKQACKSLDALEICNKLFIDLTIHNIVKLNSYDIFDHAYTTDLFKDLYDRFGDRVKELTTKP